VRLLLHTFSTMTSTRCRQNCCFDTPALFSLCFIKGPIANPLPSVAVCESHAFLPAIVFLKMGTGNLEYHRILAASVLYTKLNCGPGLWTRGVGGAKDALSTGTPDPWYRRCRRHRRCILYRDHARGVGGIKDAPSTGTLDPRWRRHILAGSWSNS
jgi:hypothetical protein